MPQRIRIRHRWPWTLILFLALLTARSHALGDAPGDEPLPAPPPKPAPNPESPPKPAPPPAPPAVPEQDGAEADEDDEEDSYESPLYGLDELWPGEGDLPSGWRAAMATDGPWPVFMPEQLRALLGPAADDLALIQIRALAMVGPREAQAEFAMLASELDPKSWRPQLEREAVARAWTLANLGDPSRVLIVSGPEAARQSFVSALCIKTVQDLCDRCYRAMRSAVVDQQPIRFWLAREYLGAAANMEPQAGGVHALEGQVSLAMRDSDRAIEMFRKALADDVLLRPRPGLAVLAAGLLGHELLRKHQPALLEEARMVLERAVAWEESEEDIEQRFNNRYNLACVKASLKDADAALVDLESSLTFARTHLPRIYFYAWRYARDRDPDLSAVRGDPRFKALMERLSPRR